LITIKINFYTDLIPFVLAFSFLPSLYSIKLKDCNNFGLQFTSLILLIGSEANTFNELDFISFLGSLCINMRFYFSI
jgi:hypothetical protein